MSNVIAMNVNEFETLRHEGRTKARVFYIVDDIEVGWSPDGIGFYWYDTLLQAQHNHEGDV